MKKLSERFVLRANDDNYGTKSELWSKLSTVLLVGLRVITGRARNACFLYLRRP